MSQKIFSLALGTMLLALCAFAQAQQSKKVYRIGYLSSRLGIEAREEAFLKGLREQGVTTTNLDFVFFGFTQERVWVVSHR